MKGSRRKSNVFVVDTAYQLLNAIEAVHSLELSNNHLIIIENAGRTREEFRPLIELKNWASVIFLMIAINTVTYCSILQNPRLPAIVRNWHYQYLRFKLMRRVNKILKSYQCVANLFLGHYWIEYKYYMRHFANTLKHNTLFLLDDGLDTLDINDRRNHMNCTKPATLIANDTNCKSILKRFKEKLRKKYFDWNTEEIENLTFFTTYELQVREGDHLIKNEYSYLRSLIVTDKISEEVLFVGQDLVEGGVMVEDVYLKYLRKVKDFFGINKIIYVPHPKETLTLINRIQDSLGFEVKKFGLPIEYAIIIKGNIPKVICSFCSSAIESCSNILGRRIKIIAFYLYPKHLMRDQHIIESFYMYLEKKNKPNLEIKKMEFDS
jgi:hypothetical protein